jgi:hypothetical protein
MKQNIKTLAKVSTDLEFKPNKPGFDEGLLA